MTEAQLKNLKPAKKGEIRNPEGGRTHNPLTKALKKLTIETYREVIELALTSNIKALKEIAEHPKTPAVQVGVAFALIGAVKKGDWEVLEKIASRIVGKIPDQLNVVSQNHVAVAIVDEAKMKESLKKLKEEY